MKIEELKINNLVRYKNTIRKVVGVSIRYNLVAVIENNKSNSTYYDTRAEATLAAISSALKHLTNNKK